VLVPKQLLRSGMTGDVPYYGGRFTPAQAHAASHRQQATAAWGPSDRRAALRHLLDTGVITEAEHGMKDAPA
jgi:hypothetical protein